MSKHDDMPYTTGGWLPIDTAPKDGSEVLLFRLLAQKTQDPIMTIRKSIPRESHVWEATIPPGCDGKNFTEGSCYATHWMPLPEPPLWTIASNRKRPMPQYSRLAKDGAHVTVTPP